MFEFALFILVFIGIMAVSALIFGSWFLIMIVRGIAGFLGFRPMPPATPIGPRRPSGAVQTGPMPNQRNCPYELCKSPNDSAARFCRRCGRELAAPSPVKVARRAAMW